MNGDRPSDVTRFGDALRSRRFAAGLTQEALAERANLSRRGISDLERGARTHSHRETLKLLVAALACVWDMGVICHERLAWSRYLFSDRTESAKRAWLEDVHQGRV